MGVGFSSKCTLTSKIVGLATPANDKLVKVHFDDNPTAMDVALNQLSRVIPSIPGGYKSGDNVYYCGEPQSFFNGDRLMFGQMGQVVGRSTANDGNDDRRAKVLLDGNRTAISLFLSQISKTSPICTGGLKPGGRIFYCGTTKQDFANGDKLRFGMVGEVSGRSTVGDGNDQKRVKVRLDGNKGPVTVLFNEVAKPISEEEQQKYLARLEEEERRFQEEEAIERRQQETEE